MKYVLLFSILLTQLAQAQSGRTLHSGLPVLEAGVDTIRFSVEEYRSNWIVSPSLVQDTLRIASLQTLHVRFVSGIDSLEYAVAPGEAKHFLVRGRTGFAHTVIHNRASWNTIRHSRGKGADSLRFLFNRQPEQSAYFRELRRRYAIDSLLQGASSDSERVLRALHWVHGQWKHNGGQAPQKGDALSILEEAATGKGFPCFAYAEVLRAVLNSVGIPTRRLALKTRQVETDPYASGHVANEVYLRDLQRWVFVDPQEDVFPVLNGQPLNAVEFQQAITSKKPGLVLRSRSTVNKNDYLDFVYPYLFYFDAGFDQRYDVAEKQRVGGMSALMLVPKGSPNPKKAGFYNNQLIDYCRYTYRLRDFYQAPLLR